MIPELVAVLRRIDPDITDKDIADTLWLALQIRKAVGRPEPDERKPSDGEVTPPEAANELLAKGKTSPPPEPSPSKPPTLSPKSPTSGLHPGSSSESSDGQQLSASPFPNPAATALPGALDIARTLRSFRKRVPQRTQFVLNEEATARRIAEEDIWVPVLDYASTRWLDIALVVDIGASMTIWRQTLIELRRLLAHHGAFRDVRLWELDTNDHERVWLYAGAGEGIQQRQPRRELELIDTSGRRLILVVTDCVSAAWHSGAVARVLAQWGGYNPVTLLQVLPPSGSGQGLHYVWQTLYACMHRPLVLLTDNCMCKHLSIGMMKSLCRRYQYLL